MTFDPRAARLHQAIADGDAVSDRDFDALYPVHVRNLSDVFWTPMRVAQRAAGLLAPRPGMRVLDVGAGVGKLCIVTAIAARAMVTGLEHREHLVEIARETALRMNARVRFLHGELPDVDWEEFDAFYFYNPFHENVIRANAIDYAVELSQRRFILDVQAALRGIARAPEGTRVVTYHGLGADLPPAYRLAASECAGSDALKLWIKGPVATDSRERGLLQLARIEEPRATT